MINEMNSAFKSIELQLHKRWILFVCGCLFGEVQRSELDEILCLAYILIINKTDNKKIMMS